MKKSLGRDAFPRRPPGKRCRFHDFFHSHADLWDKGPCLREATSSFPLMPNIKSPISNAPSHPSLFQKRHQLIDTEVGKDLAMPIHGGGF